MADTACPHGWRDVGCCIECTPPPLAERPTCSGGTTKLGRLFQECLVPARFVLVQPVGMGQTVRTRHACSRHLVQMVTRMTRPGGTVLVERLKGDS